MKTFLVLITLSISSASFAQANQTKKRIDSNTIESPLSSTRNRIDSGRVEVIEDNNLGVLIEKYNSTKKDIGFRVQIHSGLARVETLKAQTNFIKLYPDVSTYVIYQQPNFKLRVGDFENRLEVNHFYEEMKETFPGAFIIQDEINPQIN